MENDKSNGKIESGKWEKTPGQWDTGTAVHKLNKLNALRLSQTVPRLGTAANL